MKNCHCDRFLNQQMYENIRKRCNTPPKPPKPPRHPNGIALTYRWQCGQICLHCDERSTGISFDVNLPKNKIQASSRNLCSFINMDNKKRKPINSPLRFILYQESILFVIQFLYVLQLFLEVKLDCILGNTTRAQQNRSKVLSNELGEMALCASFQMGTQLLLYPFYS